MYYRNAAACKSGSGACCGAVWQRLSGAEGGRRFRGLQRSRSCRLPAGCSPLRPRKHGVERRVCPALSTPAERRNAHKGWRRREPRPRPVQDDCGEPPTTGHRPGPAPDRASLPSAADRTHPPRLRRRRSSEHSKLAPRSGRIPDWLARFAPRGIPPRRSRLLSWTSWPCDGASLSRRRIARLCNDGTPAPGAPKSLFSFRRRREYDLPLSESPWPNAPAGRRRRRQSGRAPWRRDRGRVTPRSSWSRAARDSRP